GDERWSRSSLLNGSSARRILRLILALEPTGAHALSPTRYQLLIALLLVPGTVLAEPPVKVTKKAVKVSDTKTSPYTLRSKADAEHEKAVMRKKHQDQRRMRDLYHGWTTGEGMWSEQNMPPLRRALLGSSDPESDFLTLAEARVLPIQKAQPGFMMKHRHEGLISTARSNLLAATKAKDPVRIKQARKALADQERTNHLEKMRFMEGVRKIIAVEQPQLMCNGADCGTTGRGPGADGVRHMSGPSAHWAGERFLNSKDGTWLRSPNDPTGQTKPRVIMPPPLVAQ
ncbi:MAG: hypothetical protein QF464_16385, partial [Myxococcota bacterium]|nr:hypothetical protein [Myxococcota bacterium]